MNKSKIEWCDYTWNPVTGCLHGCEYCYARRIARRFCTNKFGKNEGLLAPCDGDCKACSDMDGLEFLSDQVRWNHSPKEVYPFGFMPTLHPHRLGEPQKLKKPSNIFVCSMADLFGNWAPDEWIQKVFKACEAAPQHRYLFLTKNPGRYRDSQITVPLPTSDKYWYGTTVCNTGDFVAPSRAHDLVQLMGCKRFLSLEPLLGQLYGIGLSNLHCFDWIILGAETGNRKNKVVPKREWIHDIVNQCRDAGVPIFMKNSLTAIWGAPLIQEYPWEG